MTKQKPKTDSPRLNIPKGWIVLGFTTTLLLVPIVLYFTLYISARTDYLTNRDFRQLASISSQLEDRIYNLKGLFFRAVTQTILDQSDDTKTSRSRILPVSEQDKPKISLKEEFQHNLGLSLQAEIAPDLERSPSRKAVEERLHEGEATVTMRLATGGETSTIYFVWCATPACFMRAEASVRLEDIVSPLIGKRNLESLKGSEHQEGFDSILIASVVEENAKGDQNSATPSIKSKVIFQQGASDLDIDSLNSLPRSDAVDKTVDLHSLSENSTTAEVLLADTRYRIYSQPVEIRVSTSTAKPVRAQSKTIPEAAEHETRVDEKQTDEVDNNSPAQDISETHWVVCGLVQGSHFRREAWAFPYTWLIVVVFLIMVIALSWPFLKLHFIGRKDRLKLADVYWLFFSLLIGSAVLTLFMLFAVGYIRSEYVLDNQLKQFSDQVNKNFELEIQSILAQLDQLESKGAHDLSESNPQPSVAPRGSNEFELEQFPDATRINILQPEPAEIGVASENYPFFHTVVWMDENGNRRLEWTIDSKASKGGFPDRDYFTRIIEGKTRGPEVPALTNAPQFWLEPITSRLTAEKIVVVSAPLKANDKARVIVLRGVAMTSLVNTVVPPGFGYRVIDNSGTDPSDDKWNERGKVLFQSSESQQTKENFFEECDNDRSLRSLVYGRAADFTTVNYKGETHRLFISPVKGFQNWSLVVFRNKQPLRTVYLEILTIAGFIFLGYAIILLVPFTIAYIIKIRRNTNTEWIWPTQLLADTYKKTLYANLIVLALSVAVILGALNWTGHDRWLPIFIVSLLAFAGILVLTNWLKLHWLVSGLSSTVDRFKLNRLIDRGDAYVCNLVAVVVLAGVLPAVVFYKVAYNEGMKLYVKHAQLTMAQRLAERSRLVHAEYSTERTDRASNPSPFGTNDQDAEQFIQRRLTEGRDVYTDFFFETRREPYNSSQPLNCDNDIDGLFSGFSEAIPWANDMNVEMQGLTYGKAADQLWCWHSEANSSTFQLQLPEMKNWIIVTQLDRFFYSWTTARIFMVAGFVLIFLILLALARFMVRRIFLFDVTESLYLPTLSIANVQQNSFLVQSSPLVTVNGNSNTDCCYIDLATEASQNDWVTNLATRSTARHAPRTIVIDHFEFRMTDHSYNGQKLQLIRLLLAADKVIVIKCSHLPAAFSFTGPKQQCDNDKAAELFDTWAEIMTRFRRVYESKPTDAVLNKAIEDLTAELNSNATLTQQHRDKLLELANCIRTECSVATWLNDIGKDIISSLATEHDVERNYVVGQLLDRTELLYRKLWNDCANSEKLTLLHLSQDRLLSHNDPDIKPLMQRGLIVCAPDIRLMNETFKAFVLSQCFHNVYESAEIQKAETQARSDSVLESFRIPILVGFIAAVVFLFLTQKDLANSSWTFVTAATTSLPIIFKVLGVFQSNHTGQKLFHG